MEILTIIEERERSRVYDDEDYDSQYEAVWPSCLSCAHTHTVPHSLSIIVNLQDFELSSPILTVSFTLYVSLKVPDSYWQILSLNDDS